MLGGSVIRTGGYAARADTGGGPDGAGGRSGAVHAWSPGPVTAASLTAVPHRCAAPVCRASVQALVTGTAHGTGGDVGQ